MSGTATHAHHTKHQKIHLAFFVPFRVARVDTPFSVENE
jgi:hypothetical protein